jgi:polyhydroxyalkanoate synthase subunit PhaC
MFGLQTPEADRPKDKRFKHPQWTENVIVKFVKESYLVAAKSILSSVREVKHMDEVSHHDGRRSIGYVRVRGVSGPGTV